MAAGPAHGPEEVERPGEAAVFALLGDLYLDPPTADQLATVRTWASRWAGLASAPDLEAALEPLATVDPEDATRLNEAFTELFRGVVPDAPDPPYESLYRDGQLQGPSAQAVTQVYRDAGVALLGTGELPDHLGIELHFAGTLVERGDTGALTSFVSSHPGAWFADLRSRIEARDPPPFYRGLLAVTGLVLESAIDAETDLVGDSTTPGDRPGSTSGTARDRLTTDSRSELDQ